MFKSSTMVVSPLASNLEVNTEQLQLQLSLCPMSDIGKLLGLLAYKYGSAQKIM